jgi:sialic acid synthase SpsE
MRVELIAECSSNHGGSVPLAKEFIARFAEAGATYIKFQTTRVKHLRPDDPQFAWMTKAELSDDAHHELKAACTAEGVQFLTTVYHPAEVPFLVALGLDTIKVGSGEAGSWPLARALELSRVPRVLVGSGLLVPETWGHPFQYLSTSVYLRCLTQYPCNAWDAQMELTKGFTLKTRGWSDHSAGLWHVARALSLGASIIEVHVCLPQQARPVQPWEKSVEDVRAIHNLIQDAPYHSFVGRWTHA